MAIFGIELAAQTGRGDRRGFPSFQGPLMDQFGADEPDEIDDDLSTLEADLDADLEEEDYGALNPYAPWSGGDAYGVELQAGWALATVQPENARMAFMWPTSMQVALPEFEGDWNDWFERMVERGMPWADEVRDIAAQLDHAVQTSGGFPAEHGAQVRFLRKVVEDAAFGQHLEAKEDLVKAYEAGNGFFGTLKSLAQAWPETAWDWFTNDAPKLLMAMLPFTTQEQLVNTEALFIVAGDVAGMDPYEAILAQLLNPGGGLTLGRSREASAADVAIPSGAPPVMEAEVAWEVVDVAPPPSGGSNWPSPTSILAAGYLVTAGPAILKMLGVNY